MKRNLLVWVVCMIFSLRAAAQENGQESDSTSTEPIDGSLRTPKLESADLVGLWSGANPEGVVVSYEFDASGSAAIFENGKEALDSSFESQVRWAYEAGETEGLLDIVWSNEYGSEVAPLAFHLSRRVPD